MVHRRLWLAGPSRWSEPGPREVSEEFTAALNDGDREAVEALLHSESDGLGLSEREFENWEEFDIEITESETIQETDETAIVVVFYDINTESEGVSLGNEDTGSRYDLRMDGVEWGLMGGESLLK